MKRLDQQAPSLAQLADDLLHFQQTQLSIARQQVKSLEAFGACLTRFQDLMAKGETTDHGPLSKTGQMKPLTDQPLTDQPPTNNTFLTAERDPEIIAGPKATGDRETSQNHSALSDTPLIGPPAPATGQRPTEEPPCEGANVPAQNRPATSSRPAASRPSLYRTLEEQRLHDDIETAPDWFAEEIDPQPWSAEPPLPRSDVGDEASMPQDRRTTTELFDVAALPLTQRLPELPGRPETVSTPRLIATVDPAEDLARAGAGCDLADLLPSVTDLTNELNDASNEELREAARPTVPDPPGGPNRLLTPPGSRLNSADLSSQDARDQGRTPISISEAVEMEAADERNLLDQLNRFTETLSESTAYWQQVTIPRGPLPDSLAAKSLDSDAGLPAQYENNARSPYSR